MVAEQDWRYDETELDAASLPARQLAALTRSLLDATTVAGVLRRVVDAAMELVPGADLVSVTLREPDGTFVTPIESGPGALELDQAQYDTGEGPCLDAARPDGPAMAYCPDLRTDRHWPRFSPRAAELGMGSLLATAVLPDATEPDLSGALNIYSRRPNGLDEASRDPALLLATHASLALAGTRAVSRAELEAAQLREAVASRDVIGQAKGILMSRRRVDADEAFDILRRTSQDLNVKLAEVATTFTLRHAEFDLPGA